jgi:hypothetical protein
VTKKIDFFWLFFYVLQFLNLESYGYFLGFAKMPEFFMPAPTAPIPATAGTAGNAGTKKRFFLVPKCTEILHEQTFLQIF